jgi:hypothetical protein
MLKYMEVAAAYFVCRNVGLPWKEDVSFRYLNRVSLEGKDPG